MSRVLFIQNGEFEGPGLFAPALAARGVELETIHPWRGETVPASADGFSGVSIGGGAMSAFQTEEFPYLADEMRLIKAAKVPLLGMCLGAQLMAMAFGGDVFANREREIGIYEVRFTPAAEHDPLWRGLTAPLFPVHWHGDTFSLPPGAELLASSDLTTNQLFRFDDSQYGFQFHLEIDRTMLGEMVALDETPLRAYGVDPAQFLADAARHLPTVESTARTVFDRWVTLLNH